MQTERYTERVQNGLLNDRLITKCLEKPLGDNLKILPEALRISRPEYETLRQSSLQRHLALQALFEDLILGEQKVFRGSIGDGFD